MLRKNQAFQGYAIASFLRSASELASPALTILATVCKIKYSKLNLKDFLGLSLFVLNTVIPTQFSFARGVNSGALRGCVEMNFAPLEGVASNVVRDRGRLSPTLFCFLLINKAKSSE